MPSLAWGLGCGSCLACVATFSTPAVSRLAAAPAPRPREELRLPSQDQDNKSQRGLVSVPALSVRTC